MKFNCKLKTREEREAAAQEAWERGLNWHDWFAWYPVTVGKGDCRWLEVVEQKRILYTITYDYRAKAGTP